MTFKELNLIEPIMHAVAEKGYVTPTPIQEQAIPPALERRDLMGCAQTGTGKTAAFTLPILQLLSARPRTKGRRPIKALVLTPTRELALQIDECCRDYARYTDLRHCVIFGGVNQRPQVDALQRGVDLLVATPGRLLDLIGQGYVSLSDIRFFVLDEADRMLDMGFIHDIKRILPLLPKERQTLFFSATMPSDIVTLANSMLHDPVHVTVTPPASVVETISQSVMFAEKAEKKDLLISLLRERSEGSVLVFSRTKHGADRIARILTKAGIEGRAIHGDKSQGARERAMNDFRAGRCRVLIATDIAARGIDISELPLVINYDLPEVPETYVHRIGRTGRAGRDGRSADCILLYSAKDVRTNQFLINNSEPNPDLTEDEQEEVRRRDRERLKQMTFYCTTHKCLGKFILEYFGDKGPERCEKCSNCLSNHENTDITVDAQKIMSCVARTGQRYGKKV